MIFPSKYIPIQDSLIGIAALLISLRAPKQTVTSLWIDFRHRRNDITFDTFLNALTLLFMIGKVNFQSGIIRWEETIETYIP